MNTQSWKALAALAAAGVTLSGCGYSSDTIRHGGNPLMQEADIQSLRAASPADDPFHRAVAEQYLALADYEAGTEYDWFDSDFFARKGLRAASGETVEPEDPDLWRLQDSDKAEIAAARRELLSALDSGARQSDPPRAALAQARYDCWIEELEEGWQSEKIAACRNDFRTALGELQIALVPDPAAADAVDAAAMPRDYTVFFDFDSAAVPPAGGEVVDTVVADWANEKADLEVTGYTDRAGPKEYNRVLSERRAEAVQGLLVTKGIAGYRLTLRGMGESEALVPTEDGAREQRNRRVVIKVK